MLNYIVASHYGLRQAIFFLISPIVIGFVTFFPHDFIRRRSQVFYLFACALLLVALGGQAAGVKAWIDVVWGYTLQPSEFVKLACIITTAKYLEKTDNPMGTLKSTMRLALLMGIPWVLTLAAGRNGLGAGHDFRLWRDDVLRRHPPEGDGRDHRCGRAGA